MDKFRAEEQLKQAQVEASGLSDELGAVPLAEFIPLVTPTVDGCQTEAPNHLGELTGELEAAIEPHEGQRFFWFSVPPRHWKSVTLKHGLAKHLIRWPEHKVAYCTHTQAFANAQSRDMRRIAKRIGLKLSDDSNRQDEWELETGGGLVARGVGGEVTGRGFRLIVIDDPVKSQHVAESPTERERIFHWIENDVITRLTPDGTVLLVHTRWHPDDPIGRYKARGDWRGRNIQALSGPDGQEQALLSAQWPADVLRRIRDVNPYRFAALYQGEPRPRGDTVFGAAHWYHPRSLPKFRYAVGHGVDLAYSAKTYSDRSVCWTMLRESPADGSPDLYYVVDCVIRRCKAPEFAEYLRSAHRQRPGPMRWYASGTEAGSADFIQRLGVPLEVLRPAGDKFIRAQPMAAVWNAGRILLPSATIDEDGETLNDAPPEWASEIVQEFGSFTGVNDKHDDLVDAGAAAFDVLGWNADANAATDLSAFLSFHDVSRYDGWSGY